MTILLLYNQQLKDHHIPIILTSYDNIVYYVIKIYQLLLFILLRLISCNLFSVYGNNIIHYWI